MKTGLFFGSFNPIHTGHLIIAEHMINFGDIDQLWFVVSPQSPFKKKQSLLGEYDRLFLVQTAIEDNIKLRASNIEFSLPKPSYTIDTLTHIKEKFPSNDFVLIMGSDNLVNFHKWKNYELILKDHEIYVYNRPDEMNSELFDHDNVTLFSAPMLNISSSYIRNCIKEGSSIKYIVPDKVIDQIEKSAFYQ